LKKIILVREDSACDLWKGFAATKRTQDVTNSWPSAGWGCI